MASQVLSGASNPSYTNNTGQNVRLLMNYIADCTSMTWAGVTVTGNSSVGKDVMKINGEIRAFTVESDFTGIGPLKVDSTFPITGNQDPSRPFTDTNNYIVVRSPRLEANTSPGYQEEGVAPNAHYIPLTISPGGEFPTELVLADGEAFSALSGAFNILAIKEDGN